MVYCAEIAFYKNIFHGLNICLVFPDQGGSVCGLPNTVLYIYIRLKKEVWSLKINNSSQTHNELMTLWLQDFKTVRALWRMFLQLTSDIVSLMFLFFKHNLITTVSSTRIKKLFWASLLKRIINENVAFVICFKLFHRNIRR